MNIAPQTNTQDDAPEQPARERGELKGTMDGEVLAVANADKGSGKWLDVCFKGTVIRGYVSRNAMQEHGIEVGATASFDIYWHPQFKSACYIASSGPSLDDVNALFAG